jgi:ElaB/YqjD/DUF883 family membrane-anchored ribosome-binding protein
MGSKPGKPDAIDQEIRASRENIGRRMEELQTRLQKDVRSVWRETRRQVQQMMNKLMNKRPLIALAGAAGVGAFLSFLSNRIHMPRGGRNKQSGFELDALPPDELRNLIEDAIAPYWDEYMYTMALERERRQKEPCRRGRLIRFLPLAYLWAVFRFKT